MTQRSIKKEIIIPDFSTTIDPGENFYRYINDKWLKHTHIPDYESSFSVNEEITNYIDHDLLFLLDSYSTYASKEYKHTSTHDKLKDTIGRFVLSAMKQSAQKNSITFLKSTISIFQCIRNINDIGELIGFMCRNDIDTVLSSYIQLERTKANESIYTLNISYGNLGLPDVSYYKATAPGKLRTLISYIELIKKVCSLLDIENISDIVTFESYFAGHIDVIKNDESILISGHNLSIKYKIFPWNSFFTAYGITDWKKNNYHISSSRYITVIENALNTFSYIQWKNLFILHIILNALPICPPPYDDINYNFFGKILRGSRKKISQKELTLNLAKSYLTQPLSILYTKTYLKDSLKKDATKFIESIRQSALTQIETNVWLENTTKKEAKEKIKNMVLSIGWPEKYPILILPNLTTDNLLHNIYILSASSTDENIALLNKKSSPGKYWSEPSFMVNAFYYNEINEFIIPAASLFYPFFDNSSTKGWNYGSLGSVIGHEMVHAFDDDGHKYDKHGFYKKWWKPRDTRRFHSISKKLIEFYNKSKVKHVHINGKHTLNENLADLGGLSISLEALKKEISNLPIEEKRKTLCDFFISYAISWRTKDRPRKQLQSLIMDEHSPAEIRVNNIVCHFQEWYDVFDIDEKNKMYIAPKDRIHVY